MDLLSELLKDVRFHCGFHLRGTMRAPWRVYTGPEVGASFNYVASGSCVIDLKGGQHWRLEAGNLILFPRGAERWIGDSSTSPTVDLNTLVKPHPRRYAYSFEIDGPGEPSVNLGGCMLLSPGVKEHPLLTALPEAIVVRHDSPGSVSWLGDHLENMMAEGGTELPGARLITTRMSETLFLHGLRAALSQDLETQGILPMMRDVQLSRALNAMMSDLANEWTVERLARRAGLSRAQFALRFREVTGTTPLSLLTRLRLSRAAHLLSESHLSVGEIAGRVGYGSASSFSTAFRKRFGNGPAKFRSASVG